MRKEQKSVSLKSTLRQPVRTLALLLVIGLASFAFISRMTEYLVIERETRRLSGYYRAIGSMEATDPNMDAESVLPGWREIITQSPYLDFENIPWECSGVLDGVYNADVDGFSSDNYTRVRNNIIIEWKNSMEKQGYIVSGTYDFDEMRATPAKGLFISDLMLYGELVDKHHITMPGQPDLEEYQFDFKVDSIASGYPGVVEEGSVLRLQYFVYLYGDVAEEFQSLELGGRYLVRAYYDPTTPLYSASGYNLRPLNEAGLLFFSVEAGETADFTDSALDKLAQILEITEQNRRSMAVLATSDASALPHFQQIQRSYYLAEGRWLDNEDDLAGRRVCMIHSNFAQLRGLAVGDSLTLTLRKLKDAPWAQYITPGADWEDWRDYDVYTETFEIVGICGAVEVKPGDDPVFSSSDILIPTSCMPAAFRTADEVNWWGYSFVLDSLENMEAFQEEAGSALGRLGLRLVFEENGWENFLASSGPMGKAAALNAEVFSGVLLAVLLLSSMMYIRQRRREFALLRTLGVGRGTAVRDTLLPMAFISAAGALAGGLPSWRYALHKAQETLAALSTPEGEAAVATLSPAWMWALCGGVFLLAMLFTAAGMLVLAHRPPLELLQGRAKRAKLVSNESVDGSGIAPAPNTGQAMVPPSAAPVPQRTGRAPGSGASLRFSMKHALRVPLKSLLAMSVALGFLLALGWMRGSIERNATEIDTLYRTTQIRAEIVKRSFNAKIEGSGYIKKQVVDALLDSGFVKSSRLEAGVLGTRRFFSKEYGYESQYTAGGNFKMYAIEQPAAYFADAGATLHVEYAEGWDEAMFAREYEPTDIFPAVFPEEMMSAFGLELGGRLGLGTDNRMRIFQIVGKYTGEVIMGPFERETPVLMPLSAMEHFLKDSLRYALAQFELDPAKNRELADFREPMSEIVSAPDAGLTEMRLVVWDEELMEVVTPIEKTQSLMEVLYPVAVAVSLLIALGLSLLMALQIPREAALLRALGCTKARVRAMFTVQQGLLCLPGLLLGFLGLLLLQGDAARAFSADSLLCALLYLLGTLVGAFIGAVAVTRRKPMELLQVKE